MARYILVSKQKAYEKGLIDCNSVVRSNGHEVILTEDDVTRLGGYDCTGTGCNCTYGP